MVSSNHNEILDADGLILPGVGAFGEAMKKLREKNLDNLIYKYIGYGKPLLGICLGMQLLFEKSYEFGQHEGLGIIPGEVRSLKNGANSDINNQYSKIPQIGWNRIYRKELNSENNRAELLFKDMSDEPYMYFVHSYYVIPDNDDVVLAQSNYNGINYCSILCQKNIIACQFHPEKSSKDGLVFFKNYSELISDFS